MSILDSARGIDPIDKDDTEFQRRPKIKFAGCTIVDDPANNRSIVTGIGGGASDPTTVDNVGGGGAAAIKKDRVGSSERIRGLIGTGGVNVVVSGDGNRLEIDGSNISGLTVEHVAVTADDDHIVPITKNATFIDLSVTATQARELWFDVTDAPDGALIYVTGSTVDFSVVMPLSEAELFTFTADASPAYAVFKYQEDGIAGVDGITLIQSGPLIRDSGLMISSINDIGGISAFVSDGVLTIDGSGVGGTPDLEAVLAEGNDAGGQGFVGLGFATQDGADPATVGWLRGRHNQTLLAARNSATDADIGLLSWGTVANNELRIGAAAAAKISFRVATTSGSYDFLVGTGSRFAILDGWVDAPIPWSNPNDAENTLAWPAARASFQGTINNGANNQATFTVAASKQYLVTAWASADDGSGAVLWTECVTGVFYRHSSGNALNGNDDTAVGGVRTTFKALSGMALTLELSTNTLQAKVSNTTGTNRNVTIVVTTTERDFP